MSWFADGRLGTDDFHDGWFCLLWSWLQVTTMLLSLLCLPEWPLTKPCHSWAAVPSWGRGMNLTSWWQASPLSKTGGAFASVSPSGQQRALPVPHWYHYGTQLGSPIQCRLPPMHTHSSCSSRHTPPPAPSPIALDPCQPPPTQATRWAPETLPPTHGKRLPMCSSFHWGWRAGGCTLDLGLANRGLGWGVNMPQFPP